MFLRITLSTFTDLLLSYYLSALKINSNVDDREIERQYMLNISSSLLNKLFITQLDNIISGNIIYGDRICGHSMVIANMVIKYYDGINAILVVQIYC